MLEHLKKMKNKTDKEYEKKGEKVKNLRKRDREEGEVGEEKG